VRTFISPFDRVTIREALLREQYRGGQTFYVARASRTSTTSPRRSCASWCRRSRLGVAHGQMAPGELETS
jgi:transcription-repair coupling factor (superfamily II helicase)